MSIGRCHSNIEHMGMVGIARMNLQIEEIGFPLGAQRRCGFRNRITIGRIRPCGLFERSCGLRISGQENQANHCAGPGAEPPWATARWRCDCNAAGIIPNSRFEPRKWLKGMHSLVTVLQTHTIGAGYRYCVAGVNEGFRMNVN